MSAPADGTIAAVEAALGSAMVKAHSFGWTIAPGRTRDYAMRECCALGAQLVAVCSDDWDLGAAAALLGISTGAATALAAGFDDLGEEYFKEFCEDMVGAAATAEERGRRAAWRDCGGRLRAFAERNALTVPAGGRS